MAASYVVAARTEHAGAGLATARVGQAVQPAQQTGQFIAESRIETSELAQPGGYGSDVTTARQGKVHALESLPPGWLGGRPRSGSLDR